MYNQQYREKHRTHIWCETTPNLRAGMFPFSRTITDWKVAHPKTVLDTDLHPVITTLRRSSQWRPEYRTCLPQHTHQKPYTLGHYAPSGPRDKWTKGQYGVYKEEQAAWRVQRDQDRLEGLEKKLEDINNPFFNAAIQRIAPKFKRVESIAYPGRGHMGPERIYLHTSPAANDLVSSLVRRITSEESEKLRVCKDLGVLAMTTELGERTSHSSHNEPRNGLVTKSFQEDVHNSIAGEQLQEDESHELGVCYVITQFDYRRADSARRRRYRN
jgi:hypothetical protein